MLAALVLWLSLLQPMPDSTWSTTPLPTNEKHLLVLPERVVVRDGKVDLLLHLKGSPGNVSRSLDAAGVSAVAIVVTDQGMSRAYSEPFSNPQLLSDMLDESLKIVRARDDVPDDVVWGRFCISSFSAGYGAVRELLKQPENAAKIDGLLMLDSIYAGYVSAEDRRPLPEQMAGFCDYARLARDGQKTMILTHTRLSPGSYAATYETADVILDFIGVTPDIVEPKREIADGLFVYREAKAGRFHLVGTAGELGDEHGRHLMNMRLWLAELFKD